MESTRQLRILIVEDDTETAEMLARFLQRKGHAVQIAPDGRSAFTALETWEPDVALIDIGLPDIDGYQVARHIHQRPTEKRPLLVAITGYVEEEHHRRSEEAGIDLHLVKPADMKQLEKLLQRFREI